MRPDLQTLLVGAIETAKEAGERIMQIYTRGFSVQPKKDHSPVTEADMAAHATIDDGLEQLADDIPVLSEESANIPFEYRSRWQRYWLVDPLDGTLEFVNRNDEFCVNIALIEGHEPVLGVVYAPALQRCYYAARGTGAYLQIADKTPRRIHTVNCRTPIIVTSSRSHGSVPIQAFMHKLGEHQLVIMGSALKSCLVADGSVDIYPRLGPTSEWDTAAAQCIVEEAGGRVTDTLLHPLRYNTKEELLNPYFLVFGDNTVNWNQYIPRGIK